MIEVFKLEADEDGWYVHLTGDFVRQAQSYLYTDGLATIAIKLGDVQGVIKAAQELESWLAEGRRMAGEHEIDLRAIREEEELAMADAYDPDDPKHPTFHDRMSGLSDDRE